MRQPLVSLMCLGFLCGCATVQPPPVVVPPLPVVEDAMEEPSMPAPPLPQEERARLIDSEPRWVEGPPLQVSRKAAQLATMKPSLSGFDRGMLVYPFRDYGVYWADVPEHGALHIQLEPGEVIRLIAGLQDKVWLVQRDDATTSLERSHITVTPQEPQAHGRMTLITSMGVYYLDLHGQETDGLYAVSWRHPPKGPR